MTFDKDQYKKNREEGKRGQGDTPKPKVIPNEDNKAERGFDNDGNIVLRNRRFRRTPVRIPGQNLFTTKQKTKAERKKFRKLGRH